MPQTNWAMLVESLKLTPLQKRVLAGRLFDNKTYRQLAEEEDITPEAAKQVFYRGRKQAESRGAKVRRIKPRTVRAMSLSQVQNY